MTRYVSFGVLIAVILLLCIVFYRVMASFLLPLFLATVLVVVFRPVHDWVLEKCKGRKGLASAVTTTIISLAVIVPVGIVGLIATGEARQMFKSLTSGGIEQNVKRIRKSLSLEMPFPEKLHALEEAVQLLDTRNIEDPQATNSQLQNIRLRAEQVSSALSLEGEAPAGTLVENEVDSLDRELWAEFVVALEAAEGGNLDYEKLIQRGASAAAATADPGSDPKKENKQAQESEAVDAAGDSNEKSKAEFEADYKIALAQVFVQFDAFKSNLLGGKFSAYFKELANPTPEEFDEYNESLINWIKDNFLSLGGKTSQFLFKIVFNGMIMMVAVYFFLLDGSKMIEAFKFLSPLDDRHEQELIDEFGKVSRAVVVATLTAAAAQGILAGIGYYFAGVGAVFLLTMLAGVLALVPFVGAGSVWIPTCLYLYLVDDRLVPAILLAIWGAGVVSTIDNLIKPLILHGQSNIHPLFALLSVLGGVSALGPIGILVGPMVVAFLQTLLAILQRELKEMDAARTQHTDEETALENEEIAIGENEESLASKAGKEGEIEHPNQPGSDPKKPRKK